jgi:hypothetical protein
MKPLALLRTSSNPLFLVSFINITQHTAQRLVQLCRLRWFADLGRHTPHSLASHHCRRTDGSRWEIGQQLDRN